MKKIMFNDRYKLTELVLNGEKTMTRRVVKKKKQKKEDILENSLYKIGDVIAIAQSYEKTEFKFRMLKGHLQNSPGWKNKLFVDPKLMPHHIKITGIKVEKLQDISEEDCLKEGIKCFPSDVMPDLYTFEGASDNWNTAIEAFSNLIDKVSGKGTWESNPEVFCYTFNLID